jgi:hypothetical protein
MGGATGGGGLPPDKKHAFEPIISPSARFFYGGVATSEYLACDVFKAMLVCHVAGKVQSRKLVFP